MKINKINSLKFLIIFLCFATLFSCKPREQRNLKFNYFQNAKDSSLIEKAISKDYKFNKGDQLSIQVISGSFRQEDVLIYNLPSGQTGSKEGSTGSANASYLVDSLGNINMPRIGKIKAIGLTNIELAKAIENKLVDEVVKPYVTVKLSGIKISILGEVKRPGAVVFKTDKVSLIDALTESGDLTDFGKRDDVIVLREKEGKMQTIKVDLTKTDFINSEAFYLNQNDIVYVGADNLKLKVVNTDPNKLRDLTLLITAINTFVFILNAFGIIRRN